MNIRGAIVIEGHVQGLSNTRSLGELGIPVYVVDTTRCLAQYSRHCTRFLRCPPFRSDDFVNFLVRLAEEEGLEDWLLVPSNDHIVEQISHNLARLSPHYKTLAPPPATLERIVDKWALVQAAEGCGVPVPRTYPGNAVDPEGLDYPVLLKGRRGLSFYKQFHCKVHRAANPAQLSRLLEGCNGEECLVQEEIPADRQGVVSFTCFAVEGVIKTWWVGRKLREHPVRFGTATCAESLHCPELAPVAARLLAELGYTGVCEAEFIRDRRDNEYKLIEINPRTWLWTGLAKACGIDYAKMMYRHVHGMEQEWPQAYPAGMIWINLMTDTPYALAAMLRGQLSPGEYLKSFRRKRVHAVWDSHDPWPALLLPWMALHIIKHRR